MLLDPATLDLAPRARRGVSAALRRRSSGFKLELPAAQLEIVLPPPRPPRGAARRCGRARGAPAGRGSTAASRSRPRACTVRRAARRAEPRRALRRIAERYGDVARAPARLRAAGARRGPRRRARARGPQRAARRAAAHRRAGGERAAVRRRATPAWPRCARRSASLLPRQGVPPAIASWEAYAAALDRPRRSRGEWWWELRPHPRFGTLEIRVPDAQPDVADAGAVVAVVHARSRGSPSATTRASAAGARASGRSRRPLARLPPRRRRAAATTACTGRSTLLEPVAARLGCVRRARARARRCAARRVAAASAPPSPPWRAGRRGGARGRLRARLIRGPPGTESAPCCPSRPARPRHRGALAALARPVHPLDAPPIAVPTAIRWRRGPPARALLLLRAALPRPARRRRRWEWEPSLLGAARATWRRSRARVWRRSPAADDGTTCAPEMDIALRAIAEADDGPSLSRHLERDGTLEQLHEFVVHRSAYQLKEADPHTWAIRGCAAAEGRARRDPGRRVRRRAARSRPRDAVRRRDGRPRARRAATAPTSSTSRPITLATVNLMSMLGLHRRRRGAIVGPPRAVRDDVVAAEPRYAAAAAPPRASPTAARPSSSTSTSRPTRCTRRSPSVDLAGGLVRQEPELAGDLLWGAAARGDRGPLGAHLLDAWERAQLAAHPARPACGDLLAGSGFHAPSRRRARPPGRGRAGRAWRARGRRAS